MKPILWSIAIIVGIGSTTPAAFASEKAVAGNKLSPWTTENHSFAWWQNGWRKHDNDTSPGILCLETGRYGLELDLSDFRKTRFGLLNDGVSYTDALQSGTGRMDALDPATLILEVEVKGRTYRAFTCRAGIANGSKKLNSARMWESGKLVQHFDLLGLVFQDNEGIPLECDATLDIVAWPGSLTLNLEVAPGQAEWTNARMSVHLNDWHSEQRFAGPWPAGEKKQLTLNCNLDGKNGLGRDGSPSRPQRFRRKRPTIAVRVDVPEQSIPVEFDEAYNCHVARIKRLKRDWKTGYTDIRDYDEFDITIENGGDGDTYVPFLLYFSNPANITGLCPILCDPSGKPTGIPVQLSKNWHHADLGAYLRAYALIPARTGTSKYKLRIPYGFYGTLPSASHAQLSLVGYGTDGANGNNGRWEQLAIGCWGETICFDMDMSCVDIAITDVRMLMARNGREGKKWGWTDAGWGGDWLNLKDDRENKLYFNELKTAYVSHGPCLTEVRYDGFYGGERQVDLQATVRTLRTDDYARTFQTIDYTFKKTVAATNGWLFKMGRTSGYVTPAIACGNGNGLVNEHRVPNTLKRNDTFLEKTILAGPAPWWIAFPGAHHHPVAYHKNRGRESYATGSRALVIRSYRAVINGQTNTNPTVSFPVYQVHRDGSPNLDMLLVPPQGVEAFNPGDSVSMDLEWITPHRIADDYYGPNETYRRHLAKHPSSWKTVYREALGNDLKAEVEGGTVKHPYPLIIQATNPDSVQVKIDEGVGAVPVRFDGLTTPNHSLYQIVGGKQVKLDQSVHGNDFWQTDYDPASGTYSLTFNLPLDRLRTSEWILRAD